MQAGRTLLSSLEAANAKYIIAAYGTVYCPLHVTNGGHFNHSSNLGNAFVRRMWEPQIRANATSGQGRGYLGRQQLRRMLPNWT